MSRAAGMTLIDLLLALAVAATLALGAYHAGRGIMVRMRLNEARVALAQNARFLERWHVEQQRYGQRSGRSAWHWPRLPVPGTRYYRFRFSAQGEYRPGHYRLLAEPAVSWLGSRYLMLDQDGRIAECERDERRREFCV